MGNDNLDYNISEEFKVFRIKYCIKKAPCYKLRECLSLCTKNELVDIAYEHGEYISSSKKKVEIVNILEKLLLENIKIDSLYMTNIEREAIIQVSKGNLIDENKLETTRILKEIGYIYWFYYDNHFHIICPDEIVNKYKAYDDENSKLIANKNDKIFKYARALQNIYGVYEAEQITVVWNKYNNEKLDKIEVYEFMNIMGRRQSYFWWDYPYVVSDYFMNDIEYEEYLRDSAGRDYYIPTEEEINYYMENEFDENIIYYKRLENYFKKKNELDENKLEDLMLSIEISCTLDEPLQGVMDEINEVGSTFKDLEDVNHFAKLSLAYRIKI